MTHAEYAKLGGFEGAEVIMWLVMRGALSERVRRVHSSYYLPSMTGIATLVLENEAAASIPEGVHERHRARMAEQLRGIETMPGTHPFDIAASVKAYRINKYLHAMIGRPTGRGSSPTRRRRWPRRTSRTRSATSSGGATGPA